jgi:hypothetical protein
LHFGDNIRYALQLKTNMPGFIRGSRRLLLTMVVMLETFCTWSTGTM